MRSSQFQLVVVLLVLVIARNLTQGEIVLQKRCTPNALYVKGCNTCFCSSDGTKETCTQGNCNQVIKKPPRPPSSSPTNIIKKPPNSQIALLPGQICVPGTEQEVDGTPCVCAPDGFSENCGGYADPIFSESEENIDDPIEAEEAPGEPSNRPVDLDKLPCVPNTIFNNDCNTCICRTNGIGAACTNNPCPTTPAPTTTEAPLAMLTPPPTNFVINNQNPGQFTPKKICQPNQTFKRDCNTCVCNLDGTAEACTQIACPEKLLQVQIEVNANCQPGSTYQKGCMTCTCAPDGRKYDCTPYECAKRPKVCSPGVTFQKGCNTCICSKSGLDMKCTTNVCQSNTAANQYCIPGSQYPIRCNTCTCNDKGLWYDCTTSDCTNTDETNRCVPGTNFSQDCNSCTCNSDGVSAMCTVKNCHDGCTPGLTVKRGCLTCLCGKNGKPRACSDMDCDSDYLEMNLDSDDLDPRDAIMGLDIQADRCEAGQVFKMNCNTCVCSADGKYANCSIFDCKK